LPLDNTTALAELAGSGLLIFIAISELSIYGVLYAGWSSNNKYSLLGSLRATASMISYSVSLSLIILIVIFTVGSVDLLPILQSQANVPLILPLLPVAILFAISAVIELNRAPFDLAESESDLVSGHLTEYSGVSFAFFFLAEYSACIFAATLFHCLFIGISLSLPFLYLLFLLRASFPRERMDFLLGFGWKEILPFIIGFIVFVPSLMLSLDILG
jgi:NADH:ubiquinone oxidoreductase subunit H